MPPQTNPAPAQQPPPADRRKLLFLALLALLLLGAAVGVEYLRRPSSGQTLAAVGPFAAALPRPVAIGVHLVKPVPPRETAPPRERELGLDELLEVLAAEAQKPAIAPVAKALQRAFKADPKLRGALEKHRKPVEAGARPTAAGFMERLRRLPEFRRLTGQLASQPGGTRALLALNGNPVLKPFLQRQYAAISAAKEEARRSREKREASMRSGGFNPGTPSTFGSGVSGIIGSVPGAADGRAAGSRGTVDYYGAGPTIATGVHAPEQPRAGDDAKPDTARPNQPDADRDVKLFPPPLAPEDERTIVDKFEIPPVTLIDSLLEIHPYLRDLGKANLHYLASDEGVVKYGLWGACLMRRIYSACMAACERSPDCADARGDSLQLCTRDFETHVGLPFVEAQARCMRLCREDEECGDGTQCKALWDRNCVDPLPEGVARAPYCDPSGTTTASPSGTSTASPTEVSCPGKTPGTFAEDCQTLADSDNPRFCEILRLEPGSAECQAAFVASHNAELNRYNADDGKRFADQPQGTVDKYRALCLAQDNRNWGCAAKKWQDAQNKFLRDEEPPP